MGRGATVLAVTVVAVVQIAVSDPPTTSADPFLEQAELVGHGAGFGGGGGVGDHAVALSADGTTALVGAPAGKSGESSYALIFTRSGSRWSQPTSLVPEVEPGVYRVPQEGFGASVALSADGSTALVGAMYGAVYVFTREGATWHSTRIEPPRETACPGRFGQAVAISEDGGTAIIGDPFGCPDDFDGSAWIYSRSGNTWGLQAGPLHGEEKINPFGNEDRFASTVALSGDGNTAIVGAMGEDGALGSARGAAWVYKRNGPNWTQNGTKLQPPSHQPGAHFGRSVALSGDGSRALIGTYGENNEGSGAWVFDRGPSGWTPQARFTSEQPSSVNGAIGWTVALSRSGNTALLGGPETSPEEAGKAWAFTCTASGWTREPIQPPVSTQFGNLGYSVSLASDGATALVSADGVPGESQRGGAAFVFSSPPDSSGFCAGNVTQTGNVGAGSPNSAATTTPIVGSLRQTHQAWRRGRAMASLARRHGRIPVGTTFAFSLNEPSRARFSFAQLRMGRTLHGRCVRSAPRGRRLRRCRLAVSRGILTLSAGAGLRRLRFDGRITKRHVLPPGSYILTLTAEAGGQKSAARYLRFTIVA
ncbi:MAG: hypothetical protein QOI89_2918 [Solirubrobacteraceae bacterium]|nr:hypothetical protein [Solirubrobacteraceae bacterium]